jgi:hypothetical protein
MTKNSKTKKGKQTRILVAMTAGLFKSTQLPANRRT